MKPVPTQQLASFRTVFDRVVNATLEELDEDKIHGADVVIRPRSLAKGRAWFLIVLHCLQLKNSLRLN